MNAIYQKKKRQSQPSHHKPRGSKMIEVECLTDQFIEDAREEIVGVRRSSNASNDRVRICCVFLSVQKITKDEIHINSLKHTIENYGGFYISPEDVKVAAHI